MQRRRHIRLDPRPQLIPIRMDLSTGHISLAPSHHLHLRMMMLMMMIHATTIHPAVRILQIQVRLELLRANCASAMVDAAEPAAVPAVDDAVRVQPRIEVLRVFEPQRPDVRYQRNQVVEHVLAVAGVARGTARRPQTLGARLVLKRLPRKEDADAVRVDVVEAHHAVEQEHHRRVEDMVQVEHHQLARRGRHDAVAVGVAVHGAAEPANVPPQPQVAARGGAALRYVGIARFVFVVAE